MGAPVPGFEAFSQRVAARPHWWWAILLLLLASPLWIGLLQLVPISDALWSKLPGHAPYLDALTAAGVTTPSRLPLSLTPSATRAALWASLPAVAVLGVAVFLRAADTRRLLLLLLAAALLQMVLALGQFVQGPGGSLYFGTQFPGRIIGSFNNPNHLAGYLVMLLPVWFYFLTRTAASNASSGRIAGSKPLWAFYGFLLVVVLVITRSRGGLFSGAVVLVLCTLLFLRDTGRRARRRTKAAVVILLVLFCAVALLAVGLDDLVQRLNSEQLQLDARVRRDFVLITLEAARTFWPWGSGLGSFEAVFPRFQPPDVLGYVNHAHNDYAQWLMEAGAAGVVAALLLAALVVAQLGSLRRAAHSNGNHKLRDSIALRWYCSFGVIALLLHSWVDFNLHIPALAITAAFLLGATLRPLRAH